MNRENSSSVCDLSSHWIICVDQLLKRDERREAANKELEHAEEVGDAAAMDKFSRRTVKVTKQHNAEAKTLLGLMGVPFIEVFTFFANNFS